MHAIDVMVRDVVTVAPEDDIATAAKLLVDHDISALPVVDAAGHIVGILSEADLLRRVELDTEKKRSWWKEAILPAAILSHDYAHAHGRKVSELMSETVISAAPDTPLSQIATLLERHHIKRLPIIEDGRLVGMVSRSNLVQALAASAPPPRDDVQSDRAIRLEILARLAEQPWAGFGDRNVVVADGVVHLWGLVASRDEHLALKALVETVPGVHAISDETIAAY
jgi:CBS-domain-containing membrane protein